MPVTIGLYIRTSQTDNTFGVPVVQNLPELPRVLTRQADYRFAGYHLNRDSSGNIVVNLPSHAWLTQPAEWSRRDVLVANFDLRSP